ncbi:MAG: DUF445 domain-containing protein [Wenzhouxiangellaceae bacterium]
MRLIPLALLMLMAVIYFATLTLAQGGWPWLHAFAEAAMVGAMADWFAVSALFRHPLGLPIPHTAIIPRRKDEIGASLAYFVAENFLVDGALRPKVEDWRPAARLAVWLQDPAARDQLAGYALRLADWLFHTVDEAVPRQFLLNLFNEQFDDEQLSRYAGHTLEWMIKDGRHQDVLTLGLRAIAAQLRQHRLDIRLHVRAGSPWWMPGFVDDRIVIQMLNRVEDLLLAMAEDPHHELRQQYHQQVQQWVDDLQQGRHGDWFASWRERLSQQPVMQQYLAVLWRELGQLIRQAAESPQSRWRQQLTGLLAGFATQLRADEKMQSLLDHWLGEALVAVVSGNRHEIASLISDTIASWDTVSTSRLIELQIGADLQFIRINGTLVGGLIGLLLHAISFWLAP